MEKFLIPLIGKKTTLNGQTVYGRPTAIWRQKLYDKLVSSSFIKTHKQIQGFPINKLKEVLDYITEHYQCENHAFVANMYSNQWNGIQIEHPYINLDKIPNRTQEFGFSIYFTFDYTFEIEKQQHLKFIEANFDGADFFIHDEMVRCYDINCGTDKSKVFAILKRYYEEVLGYDQNTLYYFDVSSLGKITPESANGR